MPVTRSDRIIWFIYSKLFPFRVNKWVANNSRPAIYLSKDYGRKGSLSFFGGTPIGPADLAWPIDESYQCAQPFLAQFNLADLPEPLPEGMPRKGILYFFLDLAMLDNGTPGQCVFYTEETENLRPLEPPLPLSPLGDDRTNLHGGNSIKWQSANWLPFSITKFPKFDINLLPFRDIDDPPFTNYRTHVPSDKLDQIKAIQKANIAQAIEARYGKANAEKRARPSSDDYEYSALLDDEFILYETRKTKIYGGLSPIYSDWPHAWGSVGLYLANFLEPEISRGIPREWKAEGLDFEASIEFATVKKSCQDWIEKAKSRGFYTPLTVPEREEFRAWIRHMFREHSLAQSENRGSVKRYIHLIIRNRFEDYFSSSALDALSLYAGSDQHESLLSPAAHDDFLGLMETSPPHQMFGFGFDHQYRPDEVADKILLLQLETDYTMLWMFADCGNLQFWIDPQDLKDRRFDKVVVTIAGG